jgi:hypothetical protein
MEGNGQRRPIVYLNMLGTVFDEKVIVVSVDYFIFFFLNNLEIKAN